jgi:hypothetical protein
MKTTHTNKNLYILLLYSVDHWTPYSVLRVPALRSAGEYSGLHTEGTARRFYSGAKTATFLFYRTFQVSDTSVTLVIFSINSVHDTPEYYNKIIHSIMYICWRICLKTNLVVHSTSSWIYAVMLVLQVLRGGASRALVLQGSRKKFIIILRIATLAGLEPTRNNSS